MYSTTSFRTTVPKFSKSGSSSIQSRIAPLTMEQLRNAIPSIFAQEKHVSRSDRYSYIPTSEILEKLRQEGFEPFSALQGGSRDEAKKGFTKHLIRLRHMSQSDANLVDPTLSEIVLLNSHDGSSSYRLMGGQFRLVCGNGLVVADGLLREVRVKHAGDVAHDVIEGCSYILDQMPAVSDSVRQMQEIQLSEEEKRIFARAALTVRYEELTLSPITVDQVLSPCRHADFANDLWTTFNRVQENVIRGGLNYIHRDANGRTKSHRKTRPIRAIDQNTAVNRALWQIAEEMKALKAA